MRKNGNHSIKTSIWTLKKCPVEISVGTAYRVCSAEGNGLKFPPQNHLINYLTSYDFCRSDWVLNHFFLFKQIIFWPQIGWESPDLSRCVSKANPAAIIGSIVDNPEFTATELAEMQGTNNQILQNYNKINQKNKPIHFLVRSQK